MIAYDILIFDIYICQQLDDLSWLTDVIYI